MNPASSAAPIAVSSRLIASVSVVRTAMNALLAPIAQAAIATPSMTAYGFSSMSSASVRTAGSAP